MKKLISLTSKDFLSGVSPYASDSRFGLFQTANGLNPFSNVGTLQPSIAATNLTGTVVVDRIQNYAVNVGNLFAMGAGGNFYKITDFYSTPTGGVSNLRSATLITTPAYGLDVFQTKVGSSAKMYYWQMGSNSGFIGEWDLSSTYPTGWNDTKFTISGVYASSIYTTLRIDDELFFGSRYVVSKLYDNQTAADPVLSENILDLPTDHVIVSLETDGTYLIVGATTGNRNESKVYFWDYKNRLDSWTVSYTLKDTLYSLKKIDGIVYASCARGLWALNSGTAPVKVRDDIKTASYNTLVKFNEGLFVADNVVNKIKSYGKLRPGLPNAVFVPFTEFADAKAMSLPFYALSGSNADRLYYNSASELFYVDATLAQTATSNQSISWITAPIDLGNTYQIKRIDILFVNPLSSSQTITVATKSRGTLGLDYAQFIAASHTNFGAAKKVKLTSSSNADYITDTVELQLSDWTGTQQIKRIDIYGEPTDF